MPRLTETFVKRLPQANKGTAKYWDPEVKGLVLFVGKTAKTWYFQKDVGGRTRRELIGRYPVIAADVARQTALGFALDWSRGAGKSLQIGAPTLRAAMETYLARPKLRSDTHRQSVRQQFELHIKHWLDIRLDEISKAMVVEAHQAMRNTPSGANHVFKYFRTVWNHARRIHDLPESPTVAIEWFEEKPPQTIIEDLKVWHCEVEDLDNPIHRAYYQLLLFTGLRKSEALTLTWQNVFDDHIHLPMTKNGRSFDLPILDIHHRILEPLRGLSSQWVFPSPTSPTGRMTSTRKLTWSPHTHRRTFATVAIEAGVFEEVVGRLLNHTPLSITGQRYTRPNWTILKDPMKTICDELQTRLRKNIHSG